MTTPVALITGCSSGIGRALAETMRDAGYQVWACARKPADLASLRPQMRAVLLHHLGGRGLKSWEMLGELKGGS